MASATGGGRSPPCSAEEGLVITTVGSASRSLQAMAKTSAILNGLRVSVIMRTFSPFLTWVHTSTNFVAQFVGDNNAWSGKILKCQGAIAELETANGTVFRTQIKQPLETDTPVDLFLRPEAMLIQPDSGIPDLNRFEVVVKAILFDGANSRLLANPLDAETELLVALPQNRQYDYIQVNDKIEVGWSTQSGICFPKNND